MVEGALHVDTAVVTERGDVDRADLPAVSDVPVVSIGMPRAWPVSALPSPQLDTAVAMGAVAPVIGADETAFLLRLACSFRPRSDKTQVTWARFTARLIADDEEVTPIALDLYPSTVEVERKVSRRLTVSPRLKLAEVEASAGDIETTVEYPAVEPVVSAGGTHENVVSWDFSEAPGYTVRGGKLLIAVVAAPRHIRRMEVTSAIQADLRHKGLRLPSWLGGSSPTAEDGMRAVAWERGR